MRTLRRFGQLALIIWSMSALPGTGGDLAAAPAAAADFRIRPPFTGTYRLTSFFDHRYPNYVDDDEITIYTGESVADGSPHGYAGHNGYDWGMPEGTPLLAAADGIVYMRIFSSTGYGNHLVIDHQNGYYTLYAHLRLSNPFNVVEGQRVAAGDLIGWSGNTGNSTGPHLHFGVYKGGYGAGYATDPWGWRGTYTDPLLDYGQRQPAVCLWRSLDADDISCADIIIEDGGRGFDLAGSWTAGTQGNGYHLYYRRNDPSPNIFARWFSSETVNNLQRVYVYAPPYPDKTTTTRRARYWIWTTDGWVAREVNLSAYSNRWVLLGMFQVPPGNAYTLMYADTGEPTASTWIAADAVKYRPAAAIFLPIIFAPLPHVPTCTNLIQNGDFEAGTDGWAWAGGATVADTRAHSGAFSARLGGYAYAAMDALLQSVTLPATGSTGEPIVSARLSYQRHITSAESVHPGDYLDVSLLDEGGAPLAELETVSDGNRLDTWETAVFDLGNYIGRTVRLYYRSRSDDAQPTTFYIDDVVLEVCGE